MPTTCSHSDTGYFEAAQTAPILIKAFEAWDRFRASPHADGASALIHEAHPDRWPARSAFSTEFAGEILVHVRHAALMANFDVARDTPLLIEICDRLDEACGQIDNIASLVYDIAHLPTWSAKDAYTLAKVQLLMSLHAHGMRLDCPYQDIPRDLFERQVTYTSDWIVEHVTLPGLLEEQSAS